MQKLGDILTIPRPTEKRHMKHEWQAFAFKVWSEYSNDPKTLKNCVKLFKNYNENYRGALESAYSFCKDYTGTIPKLNLFYWEFWQLKRAKDQKGNASNIS